MFRVQCMLSHPTQLMQQSIPWSLRKPSGGVKENIERPSVRHTANHSHLQHAPTPERNRRRRTRGSHPMPSPRVTRQILDTAEMQHRPALRNRHTRIKTSCKIASLSPIIEQDPTTTHDSFSYPPAWLHPSNRPSVSVNPASPRAHSTRASALSKGSELDSRNTWCARTLAHKQPRGPASLTEEGKSATRKKCTPPRDPIGFPSARSAVVRSAKTSNSLRTNLSTSFHPGPGAAPPKDDHRDNRMRVAAEHSWPSKYHR